MLGYWQYVLLAAEEPGPDGMDPLIKGMLYIGLIVGMAYFMMRHTQRKIAQRKQRSGGLSALERVDKATKVRHDVSGQIGELMAELANLSRQINGQLDTRMTKAELLLDDMDKRIADVKRLLAVSAGEASNELSDDIEVLQEQAPETAEQVTLVEEDTVAAEAAGSSQAESEDSAGGDSGQGMLDSPGTKKVLELASGGKSVLEIAKQLGRPVGEIELILSLGGER